MKKEKILWLLIVVGVFVFCLASCKNAEPDDDNVPIVTSEDVIFSPSIPATLVLGEGLDENYANAIGTAYYKLTDDDITIKSYTSEPKAHEIIIGETDRDISVRAYRVLELMKKDNTVGYVIYSDGKSVAIAFDESIYNLDVAYNEAVECFVSKYMTKTTLKLGSGPISYEIFDPFEKQGQRDQAYEDFLWNRNTSELTQILDGDNETATAVIDKLKKIKFLCDNDYTVVKWLADLYDLDTGAFYYSNSARNYIGYLPDLVSTDKALDIIEIMLMGDGTTVAEFLGEKVANKLVAFTKGLQNENGKFYHPQWVDASIDVTPERMNADILSALNILKRFGELPTYDTNRANAAVSPASSIVMPLAKSTSLAVSVAVSSNSSGDIYIPAYLSSSNEFLSYLKSLRIGSRTTNACNAIYRDIAQYKAIDEYNKKNGINFSLCNTLIRYISSQQDAHGLWTHNQSGTITLNEIAELLDVVKIYNALGVTISNYQAILYTLSDAVKFTDGVNDLTDLANVWSAFASVIENIEAFTLEGNYYVKDVIADVYSNIGEGLDGTWNALLELSNDDRSFCNMIIGDNSTYLGMPVAGENAVEGNVIATAIFATEIYPSIFKALSMETVPLFSGDDRIVFGDRLCELGELIKSDSGNYEYEDFEEFSIGPLSDLYIYNSLGSSDSYFEIVNETVTSRRENSKVLKWYAAAGKSYNQIIVKRSGEQTRGANAGFFEGDVKLQSITDKEVSISFNLRSSAHSSRTVYSLGILLKPDGTPLTVSSADFKAALDVSEGKWFKLRLEYADSIYDYNYDGKTDIVYRVYINGVMVGEGYTPNYPDRFIEGASVDDISIMVGSGYGACIYLDNIVVGQCKMTYDAPSPEDTDTITYEPGFISDKTKPILGSSASAVQIFKTDVYDSVSKVLKFYTADSSKDEIIISPTLENETANAITFETDVKIDPISDNTTLYLEPRLSSGSIPFRLIIKADKNGAVTISSADIPEIAIGNSGEWIHIRVEYMNPRIDYTADGYDDLLYKIYVDDSAEAVATGYAPYTYGAYYSPLSLKKYALVFTSDSEATVYLDNTRFWQENLTPDRAPGFEDTDNGTLNGPGGDKSDTDGWT